MFTVKAFVWSEQFLDDFPAEFAEFDTREEAQAWIDKNDSGWHKFYIHEA